MVAENNTVGPTIKVKSSSVFTYHLGWVEWAHDGVFASNGLLPATDATPQHMGVYSTGTNGSVFVNPLKTTNASSTDSFKASSTFFAHTYTKPDTWFPGSIGTAKFFPGVAGDAKETQVIDIDAGVLRWMEDMKRAEYNSYNSVKGTYDGKRKTYDDALTAEETRQADVFKAAFDPALSIPERPCPPTQPSAYMGPYLDLAKARASSNNTWGADA